MTENHAKLLQEIRASPILFHAFGSIRSSPDALIVRLAKTHPRTHLTKAELLEIALKKLVGSQGRAMTERNIGKNTPAEVINASRDAFCATDDLIAVKALTALKGVGVPVASAILAWCFPTKWPVVDRHAWGALLDFGLRPGGDTNRIAKKGYVNYVKIVRSASAQLGRTPQEVDRWLYAFRKCHLKPGDSSR